MSSAHATSRSPARMLAVAVLVIIAVLLIIAGVLYFAEPARSLPAVLGTITHPASRASTNRPLRGAICLVIAVVALVAAWFTGRRTSAPRA